mmetsp:Transcript_958/g.1472  ORF Transcript_958/g.1472 Transcript_958/m.1472 type:complete len:216 (+) Transcript_958:167-814(+)
MASVCSLAIARDMIASSENWPDENSKLIRLSPYSRIHPSTALVSLGHSVTSRSSSFRHFLITCMIPSSLTAKLDLIEKMRSSLQKDAIWPIPTSVSQLQFSNISIVILRALKKVFRDTSEIPDSQCSSMEVSFGIVLERLVRRRSESGVPESGRVGSVEAGNQTDSSWRKGQQREMVSMVAAVRKASCTYKSCKLAARARAISSPRGVIRYVFAS